MRRDPWAWLAALAIVPLLLASRNAPLGVPVAEDFDFLRRALLEPSRTLLDGGGSQAFWRPLAHQIYYLALSRLILSHPGIVAAIHAVLLALGGLLLYRALRTVWSGPTSCAAAAFPLLAESVRTILGWPTQFVDLGLFLFSALALHEASRRRLAGTLFALLAALLCKELAVVTAFLIPFAPFPVLLDRRTRIVWGASIGTLVIAWGSMYLLVRHAAHLELPHELEHAGPGPGILVRVLWALLHSARATMSLTGFRGPHDLIAGLGVLALFGIAAILLARGRTPRSDAAPWIAWGFTWFALATLSLTPIFPYWQPNRAQFGAIGLGIASTALLESVHPFLVAALVTFRLVMLALAPAAPTHVERAPPTTGAFMDFAHLVRLQRLASDTRSALTSRYPTLPRGAHIAWHTMPLLASYSFGGDHGLQVWYQDTTLRWVSYTDYTQRRDTAVMVFTEFETGGEPQVALVDSAAMRAYLAATEAVSAGRPVAVIPLLSRAESLQVDRRATTFFGSVASTRALSLLALQRVSEAESEARRGIAIWPQNFDAHLVLGRIAKARGDWAEVGRQADSALAILPDQPAARALVEELRTH